MASYISLDELVRRLMLTESKPEKAELKTIKEDLPENRIKMWREKLNNKNYMDHAIEKIADDFAEKICKAQAKLCWFCR